jgi:hypothetical protein
VKPTKLKSALDRYEQQQQSRNLQSYNIVGTGAGAESNWSHNYNFEPVPVRPKYNNRNMSLHQDQTTSIENDDRSEGNVIG